MHSTNLNNDQCITGFELAIIAGFGASVVALCGWALCLDSAVGAAEGSTTLFGSLRVAAETCGLTFGAVCLVVVISFVRARAARKAALKRKLSRLPEYSRVKITDQILAREMQKERQKELLEGVQKTATIEHLAGTIATASFETILRDGFDAAS